MDLKGVSTRIFRVGFFMTEDSLLMVWSVTRLIGRSIRDSRTNGGSSSYS